MNNTGFFSDERFGRVFIAGMIAVGALMAAHSLFILVKG